MNPSFMEISQQYVSLCESRANDVNMIMQRNVVIDECGEARLCDFGLSSMIAEQSAELISVTSSVKGTCRFMAPELFASDDARPTTRSDIWAYGCVVLEVGIHLLIPSLIALH